MFRKVDKYEKLRGVRSLSDEARENYKSWKNFDVFYDVKKKVPDAIAGRLSFSRPEPPENPEQIVNWGKPKKEQKFPYYTKEFKDEMEYLMDDTHAEHYRFLQFIEEEDERAINGLWFFNGGKLEYVTGYHYLFLQYWMLKVTKKVDGVDKKVTSNPDFVDMQRDIFYAYEVGRKDKSCYGLLFYSFRRAGKSAVALFLGFIETILYRDQSLALQSKTEPDAKALFVKLIESWKKMPKFYKPNDNGDTNPQKELVFGEGKKKMSIKDREYSEAFINSRITYFNASDAALDGLLFSFIIQDEVGKCKPPVNVNERWNISKECLSDGTTIIGKAFVTSTIEDMEKYASAEAKILWERSDTANPDPVMGRTDSGLYQLYFPAYYGLRGDNGEQNFVDEWGYTDIKRAYNYISAMYSFKKGDDLLSFRRKYPITINDVFSLTEGRNNFSKERIYQQKKYHDDMPISPVIRGNFMWLNGELDTEIVFYPDKDGRWEVSWMPPKEDRCKFEMRGGQRFPTRFFARTGCDPFDQSYVKKGGSKAAAVTTVRNHALHPEVSNGVVCVYLNRQKYAEDFFEDMIKQSVFYSSPFLAESNKSGVLEHFRRRGYDGFAMKDPLEKDPKVRASPKKGIPMTGDFKRNAMIDGIQSYIYDYIGFDEVNREFGWCPHSNLLDEWLVFDASNWRIYDLTVASGMSLLAWNEVQVKEVVTQNVTDYFITFKR